MRRRYAQPEDDLYLSPVGLALSEDGGRLFVSCEEQDQLFVVDTNTRKVLRRIDVGAFPLALLPSRKGPRIFVGNRRDDSLSVVDLEARTTVATFRVGDDPHGLVSDLQERRLFVANLATDNVSVLDLQSGEELKRLSTGRFPFGLALSPDGRRVYVSSQSTLPKAVRTPPVVELTTIDVEREQVVDRRDLVGTVIGQGVAVSPDGAFVLVAIELPKNLLPETQIYQGWMVTYGFVVAEARPLGKVAYLLIDEPNRYFADPYAIAFSRDGRRVYISSSGADMLTVVDWERVLARLEVKDGSIGLDDEEIERLSRHLAASEDYVLARVATGRNPKSLVVSPDDRWVYVANRLSDSISVVDTKTWKVAGEIDLGGPSKVTLLRRGAIVFHFATISFQQQLSCNTCHPENLVDGLVYDIAADGGMGRNLTDNKTLRGIAGTAPFKWSGKNPHLARQEGPRAAQLFFRSHGFVPQDVEAITAFIEAMPLEPNRYRSAELNEFQRRGKVLFERSFTNMGMYIPVANRCVTCHPPPFYTDRLMHDVGSQAPFDDERDFDTPQLNNIYEQAPFLHDGRCWTLEEIWTEFNPYDTHGVTNDMMKEQLNDLMEYLKVL